MTERNNVLYIHRRLTDKSIFYVGIGKEDRPFVARKRNKYWQHTVAKHGYSVQVLSDNLTWDEATQYEKELIASLRSAGAKLTNLTDGGEGTQGYRHTEESKEKQKLAFKNPDLRKKRSIRMAEQNPMHVPEVADRARESMRKYHNLTESRSKASRQQREAMSRPEVKERHKASMYRPDVHAKYSGSNASSYDPTVRYFEHKSGESFVGSTYDLRMKFGLTQSALSCVVSGKRNQHKGWRYVGIAEPTQLSLLAA